MRAKDEHKKKGKLGSLKPWAGEGGESAITFLDGVEEWNGMEWNS